MPPDDAFCEECGTRLAGGAMPAAVVLPPCRCGAPATAADAEGFCGECGFRREQPREHSEMVFGELFAGVTDQGKRHAHNEDSLAIAEHEGKRLMLVCDGVSSSQDAATASAAAVEAAMKALQAGQSIREAFSAAWKAVAGLPYSAGVGDPPSTTFVCAVVNERKVTVAWAGDSRAYWICGDESKQLTTDDSWLNDVVATGKISYEDALKSSKAHAITKWLGADADEPEPGVIEFEIPEADEGGMLLLCSDGLWNYCETAEELRDMRPEGEALAIARHYVDFANAQGGRDNITAAVFLHKAAAAPVESDPQIAAAEAVTGPVESERISDGEIDHG